MNTRGTYSNGTRCGRAAVGAAVGAAGAPSGAPSWVPSWMLSEQGQAGADSVASIDAEINKLSREWRPTGKYEPADMEKMIAKVIETINKAVAIVKNAPLTTVDAETVNRQWLSKLTEDTVKSLKYVNASIIAREKGTLVDAPDFKKWVIYTMQDASSAFNHADILQSNRSWIKEAIITFMPFLVPMAEFLMKVGGAVKDAVSPALKPMLYVAAGLAGVLVLSSVVRK